MTLKEQAIGSLETKFPGVERSILGRIADKIVKTATTSEQVTTAVEAVTFQQILQSYGDSRATEATQTAVHNYEAKYGLKDGAKVEQPAPQTQSPVTSAPTAGGSPTDTTNAILQQLLEQNKKLSERLDRMDVERSTASRKQQLSAIIDKLPETLRKGYSRISVESLTDEQFGGLLSEVTTEVESIVNDSNAKGAVFGKPSAQGSASQQGELTKEQEEAIAHREGKPASGQPF